MISCLRGASRVYSGSSAGRLWSPISRLWRMNGIGYPSEEQRAKSASISVTPNATPLCRIARVVSRSTKHNRKLYIVSIQEIILQGELDSRLQ